MVDGSLWEDAIKSHPHSHPHLSQKSRLFSSAFPSEYKRLTK